jgi:hypothetical protein
LRPGRKAGFPLLGLSKDRPSIVHDRRVRLPAARLSRCSPRCRGSPRISSAPRFPDAPSSPLTRPSASPSVGITASEHRYGAAPLQCSIAPWRQLAPPLRPRFRCSVALHRQCRLSTSPPTARLLGTGPRSWQDLLPDSAVTVAASSQLHLAASPCLGRGRPTFGMGCQFPSACRPRGFPPPRRFSPPRPRDRIAGRCRSWGSPRFVLSRNRIPRGAPAALRSFPSADSAGRSDESKHPWARVTDPSLSGSSRSPRTLPSHPFSSGALRDGKPPHPSTGSRGLRALLHRRVRCALDRFQPLTLGAPLGLSDSPAPLARPLGPPPRTGEALQKSHAGWRIDATSKNAPKSAFSA